MTKPIFYPNFEAFPFDQIADVGASQSQNLKLISREIIFEVFQPMWSRHGTSTDRHMDGQTDDLSCHNRALFVASRGKIQCHGVQSILTAALRQCHSLVKQSHFINYNYDKLGFLEMRRCRFVAQSRRHIDSVVFQADTLLLLLYRNSLYSTRAEQWNQCTHNSITMFIGLLPRVCVVACSDIAL